MISHINTVSIYVEDQDKALDFWTQVIGFVVRLSEPMGPNSDGSRSVRATLTRAS